MGDRGRYRQSVTNLVTRSASFVLVSFLAVVQGGSPPHLVFFFPPLAPSSVLLSFGPPVPSLSVVRLFAYSCAFSGRRFVNAFAWTFQNFPWYNALYFVKVVWFKPQRQPQAKAYRERLGKEGDCDPLCNGCVGRAQLGVRWGAGKQLLTNQGWQKFSGSCVCVCARANLTQDKIRHSSRTYIPFSRSHSTATTSCGEAFPKTIHGIIVSISRSMEQKVHALRPLSVGIYSDLSLVPPDSRSCLGLYLLLL